MIFGYHFGQGGFSALPWPTDEQDFFIKVFAQVRQKRSFNLHNLHYSLSKSYYQDFLVVYYRKVITFQ